MINYFQQRYFGLSRLYSAYANLFTKSQTYRIEVSKGRFTIMNLSVTVSPQTQFQIDKIVRARNNDGIKQRLVKWRGYETFISWVNASDIKKI